MWHSEKRFQPFIYKVCLEITKIKLKQSSTHTQYSHILETSFHCPFEMQIGDISSQEVLNLQNTDLSGSQLEWYNFFSHVIT